MERGAWRGEGQNELTILNGGRLTYAAITVVVFVVVVAAAAAALATAC